MERKAKLLSPLLIVAMVVALVAGAVAVVVTPQTAFAAADLDVTITNPANMSAVYVCQTFVVKATIANTGDTTANNVTANISFDANVVEHVAGGSSTPPHEQDLGDIAAGCAVEAKWTLHCKNAGVTSITVNADADNAAPDMGQISIYQYIEVEIIEPEIDCEGYEVCPSQNFDVRATVTNTGDQMVTLNDTALSVTPAGASVVSGPTPDPTLMELDPGESQTFTWSLHCDALGDDTITVKVYNDQAVLIGMDRYAFHQRGLMVDIVMPSDNQVFCVGDDFLLNAVVTNTCGDTISDVNATVRITANASVWGTEVNPKDLGDIPGKTSKDVWWKIECTDLGPATLYVDVSGVTAFGQPVNDTDSVTVLQGEGLYVEIVEPPFTDKDGEIRPPDGFTVCESMVFAVKAYICNWACGETLYNVNATISFNASLVELVTGEVATKQVGTIEPAEGTECISCIPNEDPQDGRCVGWTLHCLAPGTTTIRVDVEGWTGPNKTGSKVTGYHWVNVVQAGLPETIDLDVSIKTPVTSTKICTSCDNTFTVTAEITNPTCGMAFDVSAELLWSCGPGDVYVAAADRVVPLGDVAGLGTVPATWEVTCLGAGDVTFWVEAEGGNTNLTVSDPVTVHQLDFVVEFLTAPLQVSTCQVFEVTVRYLNCDGELAEPVAVLDWSQVGVVPVAGSNVVLDYRDAEGNPKTPGIVNEPIEDTLVDDRSVVELVRICQCCYVDITWTLECVMAVDGSLHAWAMTSGGIFLDEDYLYVDQQWKAHLVAGLGAFPGEIDFDDICKLSTTESDVFTVCQPFTVVATVTNIGQATATNVEIAIEVTGGVEPSGILTMADADGMAPAPLTIPGGQSGKVWWTLHCTDEGIVTVEVPEVPGLTGVDANTGEPILEDNIDILCGLSLEQVVGDFRVDIVQPETSCSFEVCQTFCVKALVTNTGDGTLYGVTATISGVDPFNNGVPIDYTAELVQNEVFSKPLGDILPGRIHEVVWTVHCTAYGDVTIKVTATSGDPVLSASDTITVHQQAPAVINCQILSPCNNTYVATSQEFALTARIWNAVGAASVTINSLDLDIPIDTATGLPLASIVAGPIPDAPFTLAGGQSKVVTWTLHADLTSYGACSPMGLHICVEAAGVDAFGYSVSTSCCVDLVVYPAAHLVVDITTPADGVVKTVCDIFTVSATVTNTGWADAWEVSATLSVFPEGSARVSSGGYTKYNIGLLSGTLAGWGNTEAKSATVTWQVHCKAACESTITVTAAGRDEIGYHMQKVWNQEPAIIIPDLAQVTVNGNGDDKVWTDWYYALFANPGAPIPEQFIEPDSITVKQVEPPMLVVESLISPAQVEVCQNFKVSAIVKNVGGSDATDVEATIDLTGIDASLTTGTAGYDLDDIEAGSLKVASWELHCDAAGSGAIAVTADAVNAAPAMAAGGVLQVVPAAAICLAVEIDAPAEVTVEQAYFVTAVVTNLCGVQACDVMATIAISGEAELASGETAAKDLGCIDPGDSKAVDWEVDCTDVGGVNVWVSASATGTNTAIDSVAVRQAEYINLSEVMAESLEDIGAALESIDGNVVTLTSDIGTIKTDIAGINLTVVSIDEGVATIETNLGTLKGVVSDISDDVATIATDMGVVKADVSGILDKSETMASRSIWTLPILILVAISAIALIVGVAIVASRKRPIPVVIERKEE